VRRPRVAIVHEWFAEPAGSERVVDALLEQFPDADLFALLATDPGAPGGVYRGRRVRTSFVQRFGRDFRYRKLLPLFPRAVERFDLSAYDLVLSSSHCVAHGARTSRSQLHVSYVHTPVRYAWDLRDEYLAQSGLPAPLRWLARGLLGRLQQWDRRTATRPDVLVANSKFIADRIRRCWERESVVVHPPVDTTAFALATRPRAGFVTASRLVPYKAIVHIVEAFRELPDETLTVIGDGPEMARCRAVAGGATNIEFAGRLETPAMAARIGGAEAFIFAALEDFGIVPVEAQACGTPVLAYGAGGALETVVPGVTGAFFPRQDATAIRDAVRTFRNGSGYAALACRANAERFSTAHFHAGMAEVLAPALHDRGFVYEPSVRGD
jgi:glycosyltransferase involved in cell wall biosynthesis